MCICYTNGKTGHSLRAWGLSLGGEIGRFDRDVRIGELIGRYRTLDPLLPLSSAFDADGICTFCPLVTATPLPHSLALTGG